MFERITTAIIGAAGAAAATQFPAYYQQYLQRLGGAADKAQEYVAGQMALATQAGTTLEVYLDDLGSLGGLAAGQAQEVARKVVDAQETKSMLEWVSSATAVEQPWVLYRVFDTDLGRNAWEAMEFALPLSFNGLIYALAGLLIALTLWSLLRYIPRELARLHHWLRSLMLMRVSKF